MPRKTEKFGATRIQSLAEFRHVLRRFLHFSEECAARAGLTPQQHQLILQIAGAPRDGITTIGYLAERLSLRHHSLVELSNRCQELGLIARAGSPKDGRIVVLRLTPAATRILRALSQDHARELNELAPKLIESLRTFTHRTSAPSPSS